MKEFELYLDESGEFGINDKDRKKSPSLIGGILVPKKAISEEIAKSLVENQKLHISEDRQNAKSREDIIRISEKQIKILKKLKDKNYKFVVFENTERILMNTSGELYLSMMAEGIANLMEKLCIENQSEPISLYVNAAVRKKDPKKQYRDAYEAVFDLKEYEDLLIEKVNLKLIQHEYYVTTNSKIEFKLDSARKSYRLMLCDAVCNAYLTINASHFTHEQQTKLKKEIFKDRNYIFKVNREEYQIQLSKYLSYNRIVDSIFLAFEQKNPEKRKYVTDSIATALDNMSEAQIRIQNDLLNMKIEEILKIQENVRYTEEFIKLIEEDICSKINSNKFLLKKFNLDILLYLLTVYTHEGKNLEAERIINRCENEIEALKGDIIYVEYFNILKNRKAVFYTDCLAYKKSVDELDELIDKNRRVREALKTFTDDESVKSNSLGKGLGTRLQSYTFMLRGIENQVEKERIYSLAVKDWEEAVECFSSKDDISRQYIYRSNIETEMGNYEEALLYLYWALVDNKKATKDDAPKFISVLLNAMLSEKQFNIYTLNQLVKIMGEASNSNFELAKKIFEVIDKSEMTKSIILGKKIANLSINSKELFDETKKMKIVTQHPYELIYTYYGIYLANANNKQLAEKFFKNAINVIENIDSVTFEIYKISVYANMFLLLKDDKYIENLKSAGQKLYKKYYIEDDIMEYPSNKIIQEIKSFIDMIESEEKHEELEYGAQYLVNILRI